MSTRSDLRAEPARQNLHLSPRNGGTDAEVCVRTFSEWGEGTRAEMRLTSRDCQQFIFVSCGVGSVELDGVPFAIRPGTIIVAPSGTICILRSESRSDGICLRVRDDYFQSQVVTAVPALSRGSTRYWEANYTPIVFTELAEERNRKRRDKVRHELMNARERIGLGCDAAVTGYMLVTMFEPQLIATRRRSEPDVENTALPGARGLVMEFRGLIEQNFLRHLQVSDYCALLNVTPRRLSQLCIAAMGVKPLGLIHNRLILEARRELLYSRESVAAIAAALGFEDVGYFSRFVKQHTGKTPIEFRR